MVRLCGVLPIAVALKLHLHTVSVALTLFEDYLL